MALNELSVVKMVHPVRLDTAPFPVSLLARRVPLRVPYLSGAGRELAPASTIATSMKRVLIVKLGAIGDVVMAIPAVHALHLQGHQVEWIVGSAAAAVLDCYSICRVIRADERAIVQGTVSER